MCEKCQSIKDRIESSQHIRHEHGNELFNLIIMQHMYDELELPYNSAGLDMCGVDVN